jgi:predicted hotdog family 3-hydroxylacyl-ACP dehydratase
MVLIDSLTCCDSDTAQASKKFTSADYGLDADGRVSEPMLIECLAQTLAAAQGRQAQLHGLQPAEGMLVGVSNFDFFRHARQGETLTLTTRIAHRIGQFLVAEGSVWVEDELITKGELKLYIRDHA